MRGLWRPAVLYGALVIGTLLVLILRSERPVPDPLSLIAAVVSPLPLVAFIIALGTMPAGRFLAGMRDTSTQVHVTEDVVDWFGNRKIRARTPEGEWRIESVGGKSRALYVQPPGATSPRCIRGNARQAGKEAVLSAMTDPTGQGARTAHRLQSWQQAPGLPEPEPTYRLGLGVALIVTCLGISLSAARDLAGTQPALPAAVLLFFIWAGLGGAGFLSVIVGASATWRRWQPRMQGLGRRGASAVMLVGLGTGVLAVASGWTGVAYFIGRSWKPSLLAGGMGLLAGGVGVLVLARQQMPVRTALTLGALVAGASGVLLPSRFLLFMTVGLSLFVLFQAWTSAPPTVDAPEA